MRKNKYLANFNLFSMAPVILFCQNPFDKNQVDPDFQTEFIAAKQNGLKTLLYDYEKLTEGEPFALSKIESAPASTIVIYRGWMLTPQQYTALYNILLSKNYVLINNPTEYQNCHYLPDSLHFIENNTPQTVYGYINDDNGIKDLIQKAKVFGLRPVILKDFVKSEKHNWEDACFVSNASDEQELTTKIKNLIALRGKYLNEGIVIREFVPFKALTIHSKSGMPLTEEYRLFFYCNKLIGKYNYWEEGDYAGEEFDTMELEKIGRDIDSNFFSMDVARRINGELMIVELGDGQVAGLPEAADIFVFFSKLKI